MLVCMVDEREMGSTQHKQKRGFPQNDYYLMSVSLQFGKGLWNIPFGGFKLPTTEVKNTKIKHTATLKHSWHMHRHTAGAHAIAQGNNGRLCVLVAKYNNRFPTSDGCRCLPCRHSISWLDTNKSSKCDYCTWCQATTVRAAVQHQTVGQQRI